MYVHVQYVQMYTHNTVMNIDKDSSKKYVLYLSGPKEELVQLRTYIYKCKYFSVVLLLVMCQSLV